jgi:ferritin-like metal-binding protein YciE
MPQQKSLQDAFVDEIRDAYDAERQLTRALPRLAKAAQSAKLKAAFEGHLEETRGHVEKLEQVFGLLDEKVRGKHCEGIAGIIEEGKSLLEEKHSFDADTLDACLVAGGQRAEHYEMAAYGTLVAWAKALGHDGVATILGSILEQEKAADKKLSALAEGGLNRAAATKYEGAPDQKSVMSVK